jgi:DNA repair exonuclease SbcCD ATPase subunit
MKHNLFYASALMAALVIAPIAVPTAAIAKKGPVLTGKEAEIARGKAMEAKATARLSKAQTQLSRANRDIENAIAVQKSASEASTAVAAEFRQAATTPSAFTTSAEARVWTKRVNEVYDRWAAADKRNAEGGKNLARANKEQKAAEADIAGANAELEAARKIVAAAQLLP